MTNTISIDLSGITDEAQLLALIGAELQLGGPDGNHPVKPGASAGWGLNWDALADSLCYLDEGGIWGTAPKHAFPLMLKFDGALKLANSCPNALGTLEEILLSTQEKYARTGLEFSFRVDTRTA